VVVLVVVLVLSRETIIVLYSMGSGYDPSEWARERREKLAKAAKVRLESRSSLRKK
jgi:hypothetical protein